MSRLSNARHERVALGLAAGKSACAAYEEAGYKPDRGAASRLSANINIQARVAEILSQAGERIEITKGRLAELLLADRDLARDGKTAEANAAAAIVEKIGKLFGHSFEVSAENQPAPVTREGNVVHADFATARKAFGGK